MVNSEEEIDGIPRYMIEVMSFAQMKALLK